MVLALSAATACNDNFELPPVIYPFSEANTTIADLKTEYWQPDRNYVATVSEVPGSTDGAHRVISGRVVSDMSTGNIYNSIVIQSEDPGHPEAINIAVRTNRLGRTYEIGQLINVDVTGMKIGAYNGLMQLGAEGTYNNAPSMTFMESDVFEAACIPVGTPDPAKVDTAVVTIPDIIAAKGNAEGLQRWQSRLVRFDDVTFDTPGQPLAGDQNTNRTFRDAQGNSLIVRTSSYASFKSSPVPAGKGSVVGILSYYGTDWQILLNNTDGLIGFDGRLPEDPSSGPVNSIDQTFDASTEIPAGWTQVQIAGDKKWYIPSFNGNNYAAMTGYKGTAPFDSWLMTPGIEIEKCESKILTFDTQAKGNGAKTTVFEVYVLDNADPAKATVKTRLNPTLATAPDDVYSSWTASGNLDLSAFKGTVYIAFRYYATQDANYGTWCVDNVRLNVKE